MLTSLSLEAQALEGIKLVKAGFTATPAKEDFRKQEPASSAEMPLKALENGKVFFWTEIECTQECGQLGAEKVLVAHRQDHSVHRHRRARKGAARGTRLHLPARPPQQTSQRSADLSCPYD
jgi:hypothetical protein